MSRGALGLGDGNYNVAIGLNAGRGVAGSRRVGNVLLGVESGEAITAAINNIYLGYRAGEGMTDGNNNIILAYDRDLLTTSSSNMLDIGGIIFGTGISTTGSTVDSDANIGIGTQTPTAKMNVIGDLNVTGRSVFGELTIVESDGNLTMTSPNGTKFNCGVTNGGVFQCT